MSEYYTFDCGCKFRILDNTGEFPHIEFNPKLENINLECSRTWDLISSGNTKGCFQLESRLGQTMAKKLKPRNIEHLAGLISILRPGCISGDTSIYIKEHMHSVDHRPRFIKAKIRNMAKNPSRFTHILSYNEETGCFVNNKILNVFYTGDKECFKIIVRSNERKTSAYGNKEYKLECTADHKLLTPDGWRPLKDINIGDRILVTKRKGTKVPGLGHKIFRQRCYNTYKTKCIFCDWDKGSLDVNHIVGNRFTNNDPDNLCYLCPNHHREFTEGNISQEQIIEYKNKHKLPMTIDGKWCTLADKISIGIKDVYDISMEAPHHNFIAGGVIVHNCLEAYRDGKSVSNHYIDKKNNNETVDYYHPCLTNVLEKTYGEMIYQEQAMEISRVVSGFNLQEADILRKAIGKKKADLMAKVKTSFLDGAAKQNIVDKNTAEEIFGWIEKSQRYSFNKSHAISYAMNAYLSAFTKAHFPKVFFASYLKFAKDKIDPQQEIKELVRNANEMDITIHTPDIRKLNRLFAIRDNKIYFGLTDIKGLGDSVFTKMIELIESNKIDLNKCTWHQLLYKILMNINSTAAKALISCGALDHINKTRTEMLFEYDLFSSLTTKEIEKCAPIIDNGENSLKHIFQQLLLQTKINIKRKSIIQNLIDTIDNPPYSLLDKIEWLSDSENNLLGASITCSKLDSYNIEMTNTNCKEFKQTHKTDNIILAAEIVSANVTKTKKGKTPGLEMAFITGEDQYGILDSIVLFPETWIKYKAHIFEGNILIFAGKKSKNKDSLIVDKCFVPQA